MIGNQLSWTVVLPNKGEGLLSCFITATGLIAPSSAGDVCTEMRHFAKGMLRYTVHGLSLVCATGSGGAGRTAWALKPAVHDILAEEGVTHLTCAKSLHFPRPNNVSFLLPLLDLQQQCSIYGL